MTELKVGDRVRFTADYLRSTGQLLGGEGLHKWTVVECGCDLCLLGRHVAVSQPSFFHGGRRHINRANLQKVGTLHADRVPQVGFLKRYKGLHALLFALLTLFTLLPTSAGAKFPPKRPIALEVRGALETIRAELAVDPAVDQAKLAALDFDLIRYEATLGLVRCGKTGMKNGCFVALEIPLGLPFAGARGGIIVYRLDLEPGLRAKVLLHEARHALLWLLHDERWTLGEEAL